MVEVGVVNHHLASPGGHDRAVAAALVDFGDELAVDASRVEGWGGQAGSSKPKYVKLEVISLSTAPGRLRRARPDLLAGGPPLGAGRLWRSPRSPIRRGTLGREEGKRSRGELVLEALDHAEAYHAAEALRALDPNAYRPFNLVVADAIDAFWVRHAGDGRIAVLPVPVGMHMIAHGELDDPSSARVRRYLPQFRFVPPPKPERGDWATWTDLLADRGPEGGDPREAMCILTDGPYGTVSSALVALPRHVTEPHVYLHADGPPDEAPFMLVAG